MNALDLALLRADLSVSQAADTLEALVNHDEGAVAIVFRAERMSDRRQALRLLAALAGDFAAWLEVDAPVNAPQRVEALREYARLVGHAAGDAA